ncbi:MAG TPA: hypothetical protein VHO94_06505 [Oscillospiraceae bacterium]|nr:hypothetical protein [Oscillospiraceae bacterium]
MVKAKYYSLTPITRRSWRTAYLAANYGCKGNVSEALYVQFSKIGLKESLCLSV